MKKVLFPILALVLALGLSLPMAAPVAASPGELVTNGGFETPDIGDNTYSLIADGTGTSWTVSWVGTHPAPPYLELQSGIAGSAYEGDQLCELGSTFATQISQNLATVANGYYLLSFAFSPRPSLTWGTAAQAKMQVKWDGAVVGDLQRAYTESGDTEWTTHSYVVQASGASTTLMFIDTGTDDAGGPYLDDVSVVPISIAISKTANKTRAKEGDTIIYTYTVTNTGDVPLSNVQVTDPSVHRGPAYVSGDDGDDGILGLTETWIFRAAYRVPWFFAGPVTNTGTATAEYDGTEVDDSSDEVVVHIVHNPSLELEKSTPCDAYYNGTEVTYSFAVHNDGDCSLTLVEVLDRLMSPVVWDDQQGDGSKSVYLDPCETWVFTADYVLECDGITRTELTNRAAAFGTDVTRTTVQSPVASHTVTIFQWLPRTIGFWGNWDNHIAVEDMRQLVADVDDQSTYFGLADPGPTAGGAVRNLLERMKGKMDADKAEKMLAKQLLAAWLSVKSYEAWVDAGKLYGSPDWAMNPDATVYIDGTADGTVIELLHRIEGAIAADMGKDGLLLAKDILEDMNSAESNCYSMFMP